MANEYQDPIQNVAPGGSIRFFRGLGLDRNYDNTFYFDTQSEQTAFFAEKASNEITYSTGSTDNPTMIIKSPFIRTFMIPANSAELFDYDYIQVITNTNDESRPAMTKPLYMFITGVDFINQNVAIITCELDVIQTFMFDWDLGTQSVAQMHSNEIYKPFSDEIKTPETYTPPVSEVCKTAQVAPTLTNEPGFLVIATEAPHSVTITATGPSYNIYWYGFSAAKTILNITIQSVVPVTDVDGSQFVYVYVTKSDNGTAVENLLKLLAHYNIADNMSAIKSIVACPPFLKGKDVRSVDTKWVKTGDVTGGEVEAPSFDNYGAFFPGCTPVIPNINKSTDISSAPSSILGYTPLDPKTFNLLEFEVNIPTGERFRLHNDEIFRSYVSVGITGVTGANPEILLYPSTESGAGIPGSEDGVKSYIVPVISLSNFPTYSIYDSDRQELFETQQTNRELGAIGNFISKAMTFAGKI